MFQREQNLGFIRNLRSEPTSTFDRIISKSKLTPKEKHKQASSYRKRVQNKKVLHQITRASKIYLKTTEQSSYRMELSRKTARFLVGALDMIPKYETVNNNLLIVHEVNVLIPQHD